MELRVELPQFLVSKGWNLSFKDIQDNKFQLESNEQQEVFILLKEGKDFDKPEVTISDSKDITIFVYADGNLIGGITYRLDPEIKESNKNGITET